MIRPNHDSITERALASLFVIVGCIHANVHAQENFADRCSGKWEGTMYIYAKGMMRDSVPVRLTVQKTDLPDKWIWKTSYLSESNPMEKNYRLVLKDGVTQTYLTDEGDGVELWNYLFIDKLYSVFETHDVMLTSSYELQGDRLVFEVTSGRKMEVKKGVTNYSVLNLQRAVFKKME